MNSAHRQQGNCNMQQTQDGLLKLQLSSVIKLVLSSTYSLPGTRKFTQGIFKGHLRIVNNGKQLVTFKVMSKAKAKLEVQPVYGLIGQGESIKLDISVKNALDSNSKLQAVLSILILATSCIVIDEVYSTHFRLFWNSILCDKSTAFIEVLEINQLHFYNTDGSQLIAKNGIDDEVDPKESNNNDSFECDTNDSMDFWEGCSVDSRTLSSSASVTFHRANNYGQCKNNEDSEASGDCLSYPIRVRRVGNKIKIGSIAKIIKPSKDLIRTHSTVVKMNMRKIEFDIMVTTSKLS